MIKPEKAKINSADWFAQWEQAFQFAVEHIAVDYHFYLNASIAALRLHKYETSQWMLQCAEHEGWTAKNSIFLLGVMKHKAFFYGFQGDFATAIEIYRSLYNFGGKVPETTLKRINFCVYRFLKSGKCSEFMAAEILKWKKSLTKDTKKGRPFRQPSGSRVAGQVSVKPPEPLS